MHRFGCLLLQVASALGIAGFGFNLWAHRPVPDSFRFGLSSLAPLSQGAVALLVPGHAAGAVPP